MIREIRRVVSRVQLPGCPVSVGNSRKRSIMQGDGPSTNHFTYIFDDCMLHFVNSCKKAELGFPLENPYHGDPRNGSIKKGIERLPIIALRTTFGC